MMAYGQIFNKRAKWSGKAHYIQVGTAGLGVPQVLERLDNIPRDFAIVLNGEYEKRKPNCIYDGTYQSDLLALINDSLKPVYGAVLHPPTRDSGSYYMWLSIVRQMNEDTPGFVATENRCRMIADGLPKYYVSTPFEVQHFMDTNLPLFLDVMALFVTCGYSNDLLRKSVERISNVGKIKGYHLCNLKLMMDNERPNSFRVVDDIRRGMIDYRKVAPLLQDDALVTLEARGKEKFEKNVEVIERWRK
jgi:hypothetical protein